MTEATGTTTGTTTTAATTAATTTAAPWYGDKIDATTVGFWQNKGIDAADPVAVATKLTHFYRESEKFIGAPPEEMIRVPKANAAEADVKAYWGKIGVPAEAKDYDLSAVKSSSGQPIDQGFADTIRAALLEGRVPKDRAASVAVNLVKYQEGQAAAALADKTAVVNTEKALLDKNWGANAPANMVVAKGALDRLGQAAGLTPEQITKGWDALSIVGGIGASYAMEMLRVAGSRMGEAPYIGSQPGNGQSVVMSQAQAKAEIDSLKKDTNFGQHLLQGGREERRKWDDLHKVAFPPQRVA